MGTLATALGINRQTRRSRSPSNQRSLGYEMLCAMNDATGSDAAWAARVTSWGYRLALAVLDDEPGTARTYAEQIIERTYPGLVNRTGDLSRLPLGGTIRALDDWIKQLVQAATLGTGLRMADNVDLDQMIAEIEPRLPRFVPEELIGQALEGLHDAQSDKSPSTAGNLWSTAFIVAWMMRHPWIAANPAGARAELVKRIKQAEAIADDVPMREVVLDVSEAEAIARLEAVLVPSEADLATVSDPVMRERLRHAPIHPDPAQRSLWQLDVLETAKAHILQYPTADAISNQILFDAVAAVMKDNRGRQARTAMIGTVQAGRSSQAAKARNTHKPKRKKRR